MSKNLILIIGILLIWFLMIRKVGDTDSDKNNDSGVSTQSTTIESKKDVATQSGDGLKMSKSYTL